LPTEEGQTTLLPTEEGQTTLLPTEEGQTTLLPTETKEKSTNNDPQRITQKTKDRVVRP
jgi:hypothetical protein